MRLTRCMEQAFDDRSVRLWRLAADALTSAEVAVISALLRAAFVPDEDAMAEADCQPALGGVHVLRAPWAGAHGTARRSCAQPTACAGRPTMMASSMVLSAQITRPLDPTAPLSCDRRGRTGDVW